MRDSRLSVVIFVEARGALMSYNQDVSFSIGSNTRRERVWISHKKQVLRSAGWPSLMSLWSERGSSRFSGSYGCSGLNMVWTTNKATFLALSTQYES